MRRVPIRLIVLVAIAVAVGASTYAAQQGRFQLPFTLNVEPPFPAPSLANAETYNGSFRFCRLRFRTSPLGDGNGWWVDYPRADENLSLRVAEATKVPVKQDEEGPAHFVVNATDPELFECPFVMMTEPGGAEFSDEEAAHLREYLLKGGLLWADDFWGSAAWRWWTWQLGKVLPPSEFPVIDLPPDHPLYHQLFDVSGVPQIPNVGLWITSHQTSERGNDSPQAYGRAVLDKSGRVMVFMTFNTDFGDAYEREGDSVDYFRRFSVPAYGIGVNVLLYSMTH